MEHNAEAERRQVEMGLESGSQRVLDRMHKGTSVEQNRNAVDLVKGAGILAITNIVFGSPGETEEDVQATLTFLEQAQPDLVSAPPPLRGAIARWRRRDRELSERGVRAGRRRRMESECVH